MSTLFTINFRREAYLRAVARTRKRVLVLGVWVAYFGVLAIVLGLYGLNAAALSNQLRQIERQTARARQMHGTGTPLKMGGPELLEIERFARNPRVWRDRLARLAMVLPTNVKLASLAVNPQSLSGSTEEDKLVITGELTPEAGQERMQGVMRIVGAIREDSLLKRSYQNVKLASTKVVEDGSVQFVIECR